MKTEDSTEFSRQVGNKEARKLKAQRSAKRGLWFGFSMFGLVGWSVMIPTLLGVLLGIWIDKHFPGQHSWTLALLIMGLLLGALNAWYWVKKEFRELQDEQKDESDIENKS
ncbi:MAG: AtpZ/AtpI family protein [Cyclobacteriaceae bacterium]|jgi:ATP synthase protein I|nr:AtpZ/AtpI family protein [Cyclobacteriaceae bacterium]MDH4298264.1 AtpZ/AtpI family protein [Cyclobacteriaceae bacterium]MDH5248253.1 AtpZ/AtpI family protein [Cyclobacteriaceae bacterium]